MWILFLNLFFISVMLSSLFITTVCSPAGKGLTSWLSCMLCFLEFCHFPILCPGSGVVLDCTNSFYLPSSLLLVPLILGVL